MTDLTKLSLHDLLPHPVRASVAEEIQNRFAALTARISELEQELQEARERVEWLDNACRDYDLKVEAAEKALGEAYESCRLMEDRLNRLVDQSGRVVALEEALRETTNALEMAAAVHAAVEMDTSEDEALKDLAVSTMTLAAAVGSAALGVRAEETTIGLDDLKASPVGEREPTGDLGLPSSPVTLSGIGFDAGIEVGGTLHIRQPWSEETTCEACGGVAIAGISPCYVDDSSPLPTCQKCSDELGEERT